jgi:hypothetical protein
MISGPIDRRARSKGEARGLAFAGTLAGLAGMVDAIGYLHLGGLFVSFMSGNSTQLGTALGSGDLAQAGTIAELIALFVIGAAAGQIIARLARRRRTTWILTGVVAMLTIAAVRSTAPEPMVLAMGALNASIHRVGNMPVGLTYVTGAGASLSLSGIDRRRDTRRRRLFAGRGKGDLGCGRVGRPPGSLFGRSAADRVSPGRPLPRLPRVCAARQGGRIWRSRGNHERTGRLGARPH